MKLLENWMHFKEHLKPNCYIFETKWKQAAEYWNDQKETDMKTAYQELHSLFNYHTFY